MTSTIATPIHYPCGDGQPVAETFDHLYVILITIAVLRQYLQREQACVLGNQFLYYAQGFPRLRCAPDVMVIYGIEPGSRDHYKIWEEGEVPKVVFEMTSPGTKKEDDGFKKQLYEQIGIEEYWQFDPKGEWIPEKLRGYRLDRNEYIPIETGISQALNLRLQVDGALIAFYRSDTGEKLLIPDELYDKAQQLQLETEQTKLEIQQVKQELDTERSKNEALEANLHELQQQLDRYRKQMGEF
jgi:Uma2 family endonuclease